MDCERLFGSAKFIFSDTKKRPSPQLFKAILLLKVNSSLWNAFSVGQAIGMTANSNCDYDEDSDGESATSSATNARTQCSVTWHRFCTPVLRESDDGKVEGYYRSIPEDSTGRQN